MTTAQTEEPVRETMRVEYIVEEDVGYWRPAGGNRRFRSLEEARDYLAQKKEDAPMRILQRYTTSWEVAEEY